MDLFLFPYNGNAIEAVECLPDGIRLLGFIDDVIEKQGKNSAGIMVYPRTILADYPNAKVLAVPGSPTSYLSRANAIASLQLHEDRFATIIHPKANVAKTVSIGKNCLVMAGVVITSNAIIGDHVCILPNSVIHHDSIVGNYCLIGSNVTVAGGTTVGNNCYVGSGSSIINGIRIGDNTLVGMGSNVLKSAPANAKLAGNPAKQLVNKA